MNIHKIALCAALAIAPFAGTLGTAVASPVHDGAWNVHLVTEEGFCGTHRWQISVRGGRVTEIGDPAATAQGRIDPNGSVSLQIAKGDDVLQTSGVLSAKGGGGEWVLPNRSCTGRWVASRA